MSLIQLKRNVLLLVGIIITGIFIFSNDGIQYRFSVLLTSFLIASFSLIGMLKLNGMPYTLNKIFYVFTYFFIGIAPAFQFKHSTSFWGAIHLKNFHYLQLNIIFIIVILLYFFCYHYFFSRGENKIKQLRFLNNRSPRDKKNNKYLLFSISIFSFLLFFASRDFNFLDIVIRGGLTLESSTVKIGPIDQIINIFVRPIPVISLVIYKLYYNSKFGFYDILFLGLALLSNAPTGMPRFLAAALYIPIAIIYFKPIRKNINFPLTLSAGLLIVFPFLNLFRYFSRFSSSGFFQNNIFLTPNFDSYHNFALVIRENIITYGEQFVGAILFFVPRSIWIGKPVNSGRFLANELNLTHENIAMNFFGEGFINFGYLGVLFFAVILAFLNSSFDRKYWKSNSSFFSNYIYLFLLGMEFFLLRGSLMSSVAYTSGLVCAGLFLFLLTTKRV